MEVRRDVDRLLDEECLEALEPIGLLSVLSLPPPFCTASPCHPGSGLFVWMRVAEAGKGLPAVVGERDGIAADGRLCGFAQVPI